jgi:AraC family transcriptional regulator, melibiose operon regulatory protein
MVSFDPSRPNFAPYGFTCERWTPVPMQRADRHNEIELNLLKRGSLTYLLGGNRVTIPAGRLGVFWAALPHQILSATARTEYFVATIPLAWFLQCQFPAPFVDAILHARVVLDPDPQPPGGDSEMFARWVQDLAAAHPGRRRVAFLEMEARLLRFALSLPAKPAPPAAPAGSVLLETGGLKRVEQMALFIAQHYRDPITADQIARAAGLHPNYAVALFKKALGLTLIDCVTQHRVSHAQRMLATSDEKVIAVGLNSGFASVSRFHAAFTKACGCSPRDYRKKHRVRWD